MHDDQHGFREYACKRIDTYSDMYTRLKDIYNVKAAIKCERVKESYPKSKFKSYSMALEKVLMKYNNSYIAPEWYAKKGLATLVLSKTQITGLMSKEPPLSELSSNLSLSGAVYCNTNHDITDEIFENTVLKYEFLGNGIQQSENMAEIMIECVIQGRATIPTRIWKDFVGLCWPYIQLRLTAIVRAVIMPDLLFLAVGDHFSTYCKRSQYHQIKYAQITNSKLAESKQLRDRFIGYLTEMFNENRVQAEDLSQII
ncbi:unnamed protein product [Medioppia subpectinata]|uniref:Uncharacterized protein n=1 Tax=Medioppia subpectinata TaxID=1979941 RepID=A0A7R9PUG2_9ACAR|nr:unnamed protein product [Medioppia subpectinata]CAG2101504.1 unnamed protein product [Medioppia subpectinata]